ncbi:class I SAM-dependent methyltransferase [Fimbriimonas ginsengisoli]|uniref:Putative methyltransferase n=1 Tax=Fimbriimonas ginsengisoli Gsoil 348 TaxID=661478 RepID=A0A068NU98_FIMGI|nr:class I SAM-dependent methyltransferase [Fimbriimonas ginsengisoli]AIE85184.1 putative methyltransferase [Fimbriimonas ginsengisoli Gsoil 348]
MDPRELGLAQARPIQDAANLPISELELRIQELPPPDQVVRIADLGAVAEAAAKFLVERGREVIMCPFTFSSQPSEPMRLWEPNPLLARYVDAAQAGNAIDLACGTGRDAIFLASAGWRVTAVDVLEDALERGKLSASRLLGDAASRIEWICADVSTVAIPKVDLATIFFFLDRDLVRRAVTALRPGGTLLLETFTPTHRAAKGKPRNPGLVLSTSDAQDLVGHTSSLEIEEGWHGDRHTIRVSAKI